MKNFLKNACTWLILTVFLLFSSGLVITVHHCCHSNRHQHTTHCLQHEDVFFFKIIDNYNVTHPFSPNPFLQSVPVFLNIVIVDIVVENSYHLLFISNKTGPPFPILVGKNLFDFYRQRKICC